MQLFLERCLIGVASYLPAIFGIISHTAFGLEEEFSLLTYLCQYSFFAVFITLRTLALFSLYSIGMEVVGSFLNFSRAALRNLPAFGIHCRTMVCYVYLVLSFSRTQSFAISISLSAKCSTMSGFVSIWASLFLHFSLNISQLALSNFWRGIFSLRGSVLLIRIGKWSLPRLIIYLPRKVYMDCGVAYTEINGRVISASGWYM